VQNNYPTAVSENKTDWSGFSVYPNPAQNEFTLKTGIESSQPLTVEIWNLSGQKVFAASYVNAPGFINGNAQQCGLSKGMYIIHLKTVNASKQIKLMLL
jgi:hypothetical protein